jgi:MFS family permease
MSLTSHRRLMTDGSNIDDEHEKEHEHRHDHNRTAQAKLPFTGYKAQFTLRKSSSANDVQNSIDEIEHNTPDEPEPRLIFGLPRLVLKDKEEPNYAPIPNCGDYIALPSVPLPNIPLPTISLPKIPLPTLPSLALKAKKEPSYDPVMSCSLAPRQSCARSLSKTDTGSCCQLDDKEHQRNATPPCTQKHEDIQKVDIVAVANDIAEDVARLGLLIKEVQNPLRSISHDSGRHSTLETQEESSVASENEEPIASESDTSTRPRKATPSLLHKPQTPSLLSGASRGSSRHSLLKTSVSAAMSVDTGLPIPPVLSPVAVVSSESSESRDVQIKAPRPGNAYWGFNSDAKAAVQDAVQDAVKKTLHEMLIPSGKPPPQEPLETVPLETKEESDNKSQNPGWNVTAPWTKQYEKVPPQEPSQEPEKGPNPKIKTSEKDLATKRGVSTGGDPDEDDHRSISSTASSDLKTGLRKAVPWLKGLVHNRGHEARFTELPPRTLRDSNGHVKAQQTEDTPAIGVSNPDVPNEEPAPDMFAKTIEDLENLLSEAMFIARQAADTESGYIPMLLGNAAAVLKDGRVEMQDDYTVREASKARILTMAYSEKRTACSDGSDAQSMHESLKDYSGPSDDEGEGDNSPEHYQQNVPKIKVKKPTSGISVSTELTCTISPALPPNLAPPPVSDASRTKSTIALHDSIQSGQKIDSEEAGPLDVNPFIVPGATLRKASTYTISPSQTSRVATDLETNPIEKGTINTPKSGSGSLPHTLVTPPGYDFAAVLHQRQSKYDQRIVKNKSKKSRIPNKQDMREDIESLHPPSIEPRLSSLKLKSVAAKGKTHSAPIRASDTHSAPITTTSEGFKVSSCSQSFDGSEVLDFGTGKAQKQKETDPVNMSGGLGSSEEGMAVKDNADYKQPEQSSSRPHMFNLNGKRHVSLKGEHHKGFSLTRSHKKQVVARDWAPARKRFVATVACISTSLIGILTGIYAAEVPAIQYYVVDFHHNIILGNVFFFVGLAISTFFFWPLPLLHGRKPYVLGSMCLAMPLLFPQALTVGEFRSPYEAKWRVALLLSRAVMGFTLGFSNMNFKATLTDLFGASLQSSNPHQEVVDINDVRRHGGGLGVWLGIWTWCTIGSGGIGFLIGAGIINSANPAWGFYISICIIAGVLLLNVICPEVRRSAFRRSVAEVKDGEDQGSRRVARGEVKMHMVQSGPKWWGEEFHYGVKLSLRMLRQPGFLVLALYTAWIYGQIVMIVVVSFTSGIRPTC